MLESPILLVAARQLPSKITGGLPRCSVFMIKCPAATVPDKPLPHVGDPSELASVVINESEGVAVIGPAIDIGAADHIGGRLNLELVEVVNPMTCRDVVGSILAGPGLAEFQ
jgi:hypothetical protein